LIGPSGSGKTSLVYHVAASLKCILFKFVTTDFVNADPGTAESIIRDMFKNAQSLIERDNKSKK